MKRIILILQMALLLVGAASCSDSETGNGLAAEPELISIIPISGASGCTAIISGVNFAAEQSANKVLLDGQEAQVVSSSKNRIFSFSTINYSGITTSAIRTSHTTSSPNRTKHKSFR